MLEGKQVCSNRGNKKQWGAGAEPHGKGLTALSSTTILRSEFSHFLPNGHPHGVLIWLWQISSLLGFPSRNFGFPGVRRCAASSRSSTVRTVPTQQFSEPNGSKFKVERVSNSASQRARNDGIAFAGKRGGAAFQP